MCCEVGVGLVEADSGLQANVSNGNGVLQESGVNAFIGVVEGALRFLYARSLLGRKSRICAREIGINRLQDFVVVRSWPIIFPSNCKGTVIVGRIDISSQNLGQGE